MMQVYYIRGPNYARDTEINPNLDKIRRITY